MNSSGPRFVSTLGLAVLWVVLAWRHPTTTYHLAPLLVAGLLPVAALLDGERAWRSLSATTVVGVILAGSASITLTVADRLQGPLLLPVGGAVLEAFVFVAVGAASGPVGRLVLRR